MHVRVASTTDLERIKRIRYDPFAAHAPSAYTPKEVRNLLSDLDEDELVAMIDNRQLFVAMVDGDLRGVAGWSDTNLRHVYVAPGSERTGIGTQLLAMVEQDFQTRTRETEIRVGSVLYARGFYEANDYTVSRRGRDHRADLRVPKWPAVPLPRPGRQRARRVGRVNCHAYESAPQRRAPYRRRPGG